MNQQSTRKQKNKLFTAIDKAPFAGKFVIKDAYVGFETASDKQKTIRMVGATALLGAMVWVHAEQARMGGESLVTHTTEMMQGGDILNGMYTMIDVMYTGAMAAVATRQTVLTGKVLKKYATWRQQKDRIPEDERRTKRRPYRHKLGAIGLAAAVTLVGQAAGFVSMQDAKGIEYTKEIEQAKQENADFYQVYENDGETGSDVSLPSDDVSRDYEILPEDTTSIPVDISAYIQEK
jgi:hypothetical protein